MNLETIIVALFWGVVFGALSLHALDRLLGILFCLHGLLMSRWKRLVNRASPGQIKYSIILRLLTRLGLYVLLYGFLIEIGDNLVRREFRFAYQGTGGMIWGGTAIIAAAVFLRSACRRLVVVWKMSHEFDYAEKRQRTYLLKK